MTKDKTETGSEPETAAAPPAASPSQDPWSPLTSLRQEVDRIFDDFDPWGGPLTRAWREGPAGAMRRLAQWDFAPAMDLVEKDDAWELTAELPGMDENNLEIRVADGVLTLRGEKREESERTEKDRRLSERRYGAFQRGFRLPEGVDADSISASCRKGVLTVTLPKSAERKSREKRIEVKAG